MVLTWKIFLFLDFIPLLTQSTHFDSRKRKKNENRSFLKLQLKEAALQLGSTSENKLLIHCELNDAIDVALQVTSLVTLGQCYTDQFPPIIGATANHSFPYAQLGARYVLSVSWFHIGPFSSNYFNGRGNQQLQYSKCASLTVIGGCL